MRKSLFLSCCFFPFLLFAQQYNVKVFSENEGISNKEVHVLFQDKNGFLWAGTENGLNRFDGNSFDVFKHNPADSNSIAGNKIYAIYQGEKDHQMWIGTNEGISIFNYRNQRFENFAPDTFVLKNIGTLFMTMHQDSKERIWVGTSNDLLIFNPATKKFTSSGWAAFAEKNSLPGGNHLRVVVLSIIPKSDNEFWVFTTFGLYTVNTNNLQFQFYPFQRSYDYFGSQCKYADEYGNVWISLFGAGLLIYNSKQNNWTEIQIPKEISDADNTFSLKSFNGDTLVFASTGNIVFLSKSTRKIIGFSAFDDTKNKSTPDIKCEDILVQGQNLWLATAKGLAKLSRPELLFSFHQLKNAGGVSSIFPNKSDDGLIYSDDNDIYSGTTHFNKIPILNHEFKEPRYFTADSGNIGYISDGKNFYSYNVAVNSLKQIPLPPARNTKNDFTLRNIVVAGNHEVWLRTLGQGVIHYNPISNKMEYETNLPDGNRNLAHGLYYDSLDNSLWYAEEGNGVFYYNLVTHAAKHYLLNKPPSQRGASIFNIISDKKRNIWMSNLTEGIIEYSCTKKSFRYFTVNDGMLSDNVSWLATDKYDNLWISSDKGLSRLNSIDYTITNYTSNGRRNFSSSFINSDKEGNILVAADCGYYKVESGNYLPALPKPLIYLKNILVNNKPWQIDTAYEFQPNENTLEFRPGLLDLNNPEEVTLEYKLNNNERVAIPKNTAILFANLKPGNYKLFINQKNYDAGRLFISFSILAPVWKRPWFIIVLLVLLAAIIFFLIRRWLSFIKKQAELQHEKSKSEITALRNQMNPHFIFNTLNSINSYIIENKNEEASDYLTEFSKLIRLTLQYSQQETILLQDELNAVKLYLELECKRLGQNFDYTILLKPDDKILNTQMPSMIIQPFVENAIWHGLRTKSGDKHILIDVEELSNTIKIIVEDNGIGRVEAKTGESRKKNSFGMAATIKRLHLFDASSQVLVYDLTDKEQNPAGTRITMTFKKIRHANDD